jgi:predicted transcriptional regulator
MSSPRATDPAGRCVVNGGLVIELSRMRDVVVDPEARGAPDLTTDGGPSAASSVTVDRYDHVAAAAYPMRHHGVTALAVLDGDRSTRPIGMITKTDITQAAADGEDLNKVLIGQLISQSPGSDQPQLAQR